ncbi:(2Fe-2S)-binding protein [Flavobacteriaceae bacterium S356]|uniref:(2Fe-2S)-binding protein n=1 Tax=Asprobacillus argus TaxID=3076534 RepID=A0ABU3LGJ6_9FLAO|nr:(2Fe-2S)-binding protein [Flavobacteriaceae bacterium S356]
MQTLSINGTPYTVDAPDDMPLLWVIRDLAGLTGTKFGCGVAQCGACSVLIDDVLVKSCSTPITTAIGKEITTIENTSPNMEHLRRAWEDLNVPQCGYCQSGQIIAATALLDAKKVPTDADIEEAMNGNICRCGTYVRIKKAIHKAVEYRN